MNNETTGNLIEGRWFQLTEDLEKYCEIINRPVPKIVAVSKTRSIDEMQLAWDAGIRIFGESYAQELAEKAPKFPNAEWHYIGHLQRSNVKFVHPFANYIHSLDSLKLANRLDKLNFQGTCLVQVNLSREESKFGIPYSQNEIETFLGELKNLKLKLTGFMAMASFSWDEVETDQQYRDFNAFIKNFGLPELSMGMSGDYKIGVKNGSTMVRIGTKIFGPRDNKSK